MENPISQFLAKKGMSQVELAARLGVNKSTISRWTKGDKLVPVTMLSKVSGVTGLSRRKLRPDIFAGGPDA